MGIERRKFRRIKSDYKVKLDIESELGIGLLDELGQTINASAGGVLFRYHKSIKVGLNIHVIFLNDTSSMVFEADARVVRVEQTDEENFEIGVKFIGLNHKEEDDLDKMLAANGMGEID
jgi:hypothetical protein